MRQAVLRQSPALLLAIVALFVALGGSVYAAAKINGKSIRAKSLPGNRLKPRSVPANRLKPGVIGNALRAAPLTGSNINEATLGRVPSAGHAETAGYAESAADAQTALNAVNAVDSTTINGYSAGCLPGTLEFAGACWESDPRSATTAPVAASECAARDGLLPEALALAAFSKLPDVNLDVGDEWSSDLTTFSGPDAYAVVTVSVAGVLDTELSNSSRKYRCVIPLLS